MTVKTMPSATESATDSIRSGDTVNGKYRIESLLGEGGAGTVFVARNLELDERVALKFLKPELLAEPDVVSRFLREAKTASAIKDEYVSVVYDVGTTPHGVPFLVMEYLEGQDLRTILDANGPLSTRDAAEFMMQACEAIAVAHASGVVHRDLKPENLFVTRRSGMNMLKVLDFGVASGALGAELLGCAGPLGTPVYMPPEQMRCQANVDARSDIWSLGIVLYEILTNTAPFAGHTMLELCAAVLETRPESVRTRRPDVPEGMNAIIEKCLQKDPSKRYRNVAELACELMPFAPRRARICAERAAKALVAAGQHIESSAVVLDSCIPPASEESTITGRFSVPPPPRVPSDAPTMIRPTVGRRTYALALALFVASAVGSVLTLEPYAPRQRPVPSTSAAPQ
jgi:serine/threonine-protein kinase